MGSFDGANDIKAHLTNYAAQSMPSGDVKCNKCHKKGHIRKYCSAAAVTLKKDPEDTEEEEDHKKDSDYVKMLRESCGKCPHCKGRHSYTRKRDQKHLPSDRFMCCESFRQMSEKERGETLLKYKECARCLSWNHVRSSADSKAPKNSCKCPKNGGQCLGDHHTMVCILA